MTHITQPMMRAVRVPVPSRAAQKAIASGANLVHAKSEGLLHALDSQVARLLERRQALIMAAVTGEHRISKVAS